MLVALSFAYFFEFADINTFATTAPKLIKLWGLTVNQIAYVTSLSFAGMFIGSVVAGWIADRWGRKTALAMTTLFFSVFSLLSAFTWDVTSLGVCRVLTSAGLSAMTVVAVIYLNEMYPAAVRGRYQAYAIVIGICGTPATNLLASLIVPLTDWSWRLVYLWGSLGILALLLIRRLTESPRWYESRGKYDLRTPHCATSKRRSPPRRGRCPSRPRGRRTRHTSPGPHCACCCRSATSARRCCSPCCG
jgi:MFS transporter, putative metabolite:H+ symporter